MEGGIFTNVISALIKGDPREILCPFHQVGTQGKGTSYKLGAGPSPDLLVP